MKIFEEGDFLTYRLLTEYGDFALVRSSKNNLAHLFRKVNSIGNPKIESNIGFAIIKLEKFNGFEKLVKTGGWKYSGTKKYFYNKPFHCTFESDEANKALAFILEYENPSNNYRRIYIENWRIIYEHEKNAKLTDEQFNRIKVNYYENELPYLIRIKRGTRETYCNKCIGYGVIPLYFGINIKTGRCTKCNGKGTLYLKSRIIAICLFELGVVKTIHAGEFLVLDRFKAAYYFEFFEDWNTVVGRGLSDDLIETAQIMKIVSMESGITKDNFIQNQMFQKLFSCKYPKPTYYSGFL